MNCDYRKQLLLLDYLRVTKSMMPCRIVKFISRNFELYVEWYVDFVIDDFHSSLNNQASASAL